MFVSALFRSYDRRMSRRKICLPPCKGSCRSPGYPAPRQNILSDFRPLKGIASPGAQRALLQGSGMLFAATFDGR